MKSQHLWFRPLLLCATLICAGLTGCQNLHPESWLIIERTSQPHPEIVSVARNVPTPETRHRLPLRLEVRWGYKGLPNGLPTEEEIIFGRTLSAGLDKIVDGHGIHAMTRTGDGGRTMYYYVDHRAQLQDAIREFFDAQPPISAKVLISQDPDWETVHRVLNAIKQEPAHGAQPSVAADAPQAARR
jgi:hypothetical protein